MSNYSTNLKPWGSKGSEFPNNYYYIEDEAPVDAWDNFVTHNIIEDLQHLINLTNDRLETDIGSSYVSSPEDGHVMYRTDTETFEVYNSTSASWQDLAWGSDFRSHKNNTANPHSVTAAQTGGLPEDGTGAMTGNLDVNGNKIVGNDATFNFGGGNGHVELQGGGLQVTTHQHFPDGNYLYFGSAHDFGIHYDGANNEWVFTDEANSQQVASFPLNGKAVFDQGVHAKSPSKFRSNATVGEDGGETITESTSPKSFDIDGQHDRDIFEQADVTVSNGSTASATEDITVELYDGTDTTGTLVDSQTQSVTVAAGGSKTVTFLSSGYHFDSGTYHVNITTSGTTIAVDSTSVPTTGGSYTIQDDGIGDFRINNHYGTNLLEIDAINENVTQVPDFNAHIQALGGISTGDSKYARLFDDGVGLRWGGWDTGDEMKLRIAGSSSSDAGAQFVWHDESAGTNTQTLRLYKDGDIDIKGDMSISGGSGRKVAIQMGTSAENGLRLENTDSTSSFDFLMNGTSPALGSAGSMILYNGNTGKRALEVDTSDNVFIPTGNFTAGTYKIVGRDLQGNGGGRSMVTYTDANGNPDYMAINYNGDYNYVRIDSDIHNGSNIIRGADNTNQYITKKFTSGGGNTGVYWNDTNAQFEFYHGSASSFSINGNGSVNVGSSSDINFTGSGDTQYLYWPDQGGGYRSWIGQATGGEIEAQDDAGNQTILT